MSSSWKLTFDGEGSSEINWSITTGGQELNEVPIFILGIMGIKGLQGLGLPVESHTRSDALIPVVASSHQGSSWITEVVVIF